MIRVELTGKHIESLSVQGALRQRFSIRGSKGDEITVTVRRAKNHATARLPSGKTGRPGQLATERPRESARISMPCTIVKRRTLSRTPRRPVQFSMAVSFAFFFPGSDQ
jgi:hypothetical protein